MLKIGALIRPLSGEKWDKRGEMATSEEIAAAWRDEIHFAIDAFGPIPATSRCPDRRFKFIRKMNQVSSHLLD
mgnify:CR=1 FL=1